MTIMVRDPWADAQAVATGAPLDEGLVAARRRLRLRRFGAIALGVAVLGVYFAVTDARLVRGEAYTLWTTEDGLLRAQYWVLGLGAVLVLIGFVTSLRAGVSSSLLAPQDYLPAGERRWLRRVLASGAAVPEERRTVVEDAARRDVKEAARLPEHLGWVLLLGSISLTTPEPLVLAPFVLLVGWRGTSAVVGQLRAHRARRWLAANA